MAVTNVQTVLNKPALVKWLYAFGEREYLSESRKWYPLKADGTPDFTVTSLKSYDYVAFNPTTGNFVTHESSGFGGGTASGQRYEYCYLYAPAGVLVRYGVAYVRTSTNEVLLSVKASGLTPITPRIFMVFVGPVIDQLFYLTNEPFDKAIVESNNGINPIVVATARVPSVATTFNELYYRVFDPSSLTAVVEFKVKELAGNTFRPDWLVESNVVYNGASVIITGKLRLIPPYQTPSVNVQIGVGYVENPSFLHSTTCTLKFDTLTSFSFTITLE